MYPVVEAPERKTTAKNGQWRNAAHVLLPHVLLPLWPAARLRNKLACSPTATTAMEHIDTALSLAIGDVFSDQNYERSFAFYRLWFDIRQTYHQIPTDPIIDDLWFNYRQTNARNSSSWDEFTRPTTQLVLRLTSDLESDLILAPHNSGLQSRLCKKILQEFFINNLLAVKYGYGAGYMPYIFPDASLIAHWANLGYVEEHAIRNQILQSLISHSELHDHQADALYILFQVAGTTFEAYAETSVVDRCFELLKGHRHVNSERGKLIQVSAFSVKGET